MSSKVELAAEHGTTVEVVEAHERFVRTCLVEGARHMFKVLQLAGGLTIRQFDAAERALVEIELGVHDR